MIVQSPMIAQKYCFYLWTLIFVVVASQCSHARQDEIEQTPVRFCAPQSDIYPFFITHEDKLSGVNPDLLEQMFAHPSLYDAALVIQRGPWKRCNRLLEKGLVDMMIGGYDPERESVVYPSKLGFSLEEAVFSTASVCFSSLPGKQLEKVQSGLRGEIEFSVGIEAGFTKQHADTIKPIWVTLFNPIEKYKLLEKGRVDAIVQICAMDVTHPINTKASVAGFDQFETVFPPYLNNPAYVVFSENFVNQHEDLAKRIVYAKKFVDKPMVYRRYAPVQ